jgi:nucleoside 2-deoxyribosyltransferase
MFTIYLAGFICGNKIKECTDWRKEIINYFYKNPKWNNQIKILDPLNGKDLETIDKEGLKSNIPGTAFVPRDHKCVKDSDLIIVNLETFGEKRPVIGTIFELAWAWIYRKPVITITTEDYYKHHPFIQASSAIIVNSVEEILENKYIQYFYHGTVSAKY